MTQEKYIARIPYKAKNKLPKVALQKEKKSPTGMKMRRF